MDSDICALCLNDLPPLHLKTTTRNRLWCCGKEFCSDCYIAWLRDSRSRVTQTLKCPMCRHQYLSDFSDLTSIDLLQKRVDENRSWAQFTLGTRLVRNGVEGKDSDSFDLAKIEKGVALLQKAADQNSFRALYVLAVVHYNGWGCPVSPDRGREILERIVRYGDSSEKILAEQYLS